MAIHIPNTNKAIGDKIGKLVGEGYKQKQAIAIAESMAGNSRKKKKRTPRY